MGRSPDQFFPCGEKWYGNETTTGEVMGAVQQVHRMVALHLWEGRSDSEQDVFGTTSRANQMAVISVVCNL